MVQEMRQEAGDKTVRTGITRIRESSRRAGCRLRTIGSILMKKERCLRAG